MTPLKYIFITIDAITHFITHRQYQSAEYADCPPLIELLQRQSTFFNDGVVCTYNMKEGLILHTGKIKSTAGIFWDYSQYTSFPTERPNRIITIFQKVLRFAIRYFNGQKLAPCENIIDDNKAVIFPFPYTQHGEAYRIVADRNSFRKGKTLNFLTVYYGGSDEIYTPVNFSNLNRFYDEYKLLNEIKEELIETVNNNIPAVSSFQIKVMETPNFNIDGGMSDSDWGQYLTKPQYDFVYKEIKGAERIEGAAGTGKTLSMVLKCIYNLKLSNFNKRYIFVTHSIATKDHIIALFKQTCPEISEHISAEGSLTGSLLVTTIQEWCINNLGSNIAETEYLDKDAMTSKGLQSMYIESALTETASEYLSLYEPILSSQFLKFIKETDVALQCEMLQYEFGVVLKGRADGDLEQYKALERPQYSIPCYNDADYHYVFLIYTAYQNQLDREGQFDSDDIVLTALSSLNAPIWRRRREKEGFDGCFVDETHLFNFNELSIFPFLNKTEARNNIIFAIDKSQFSGEVLQKAEDALFMSNASDKFDEAQLSTLTYHTIFRSSPNILDLAYNIMSIGSTLFNNFDNPLIDIESIEDPISLNKNIIPQYILAADEDTMISQAFDEIDNLQKKFHISKADCLIISTSDILTENIKKYCDRKNKSLNQLISRGDSAAIKRSRNNNSYILAGIDYIGGLEFDYVIIVGVDESRVPPQRLQKRNNFHFDNYAWHRRMYVAITRGRHGVLLIGNKIEGKAYMLENAILNSYIKVKE